MRATVPSCAAKVSSSELWLRHNVLLLQFLHFSRESPSVYPFRADDASLVQSRQSSRGHARAISSVYHTRVASSREVGLRHGEVPFGGKTQTAVQESGA